MNRIPVSTIERVLRNAGADRVSEEAVVSLRNVVEEKGNEIANRAFVLSRRVGRKTVKAADITLAAEL